MVHTARDLGVPEAKEFGVGDQRHVQAQRVWIILMSHVMKEWKWRKKGPRPPRRRNDVLITYIELAKRMRMRPGGQRTLGISLGIVGECRVNGLPTLNSIVVNQETGVPGGHVLVRDGKTYKDEQHEVMRTDWFSYRVPTTGAFRKIRKYQLR